MARGPAPDRQAARRRLLWAVVAAAFLHAAVLALLWLVPAPPPRHEPPLLIEFEVAEGPVELPPMAHPDGDADEGEPSAPPPVSLRPDLPVAPRGGGAGSGTGGVAGLPEPSRDDAARPAPSSEAGEEKPIDLFDPNALDESLSRWRAERGDGEGSGAGAPKGSGVGTGEGTGWGTGDGDGEGPEAERARVSRRIARDLHQALAESRVRDGLVDPYFRELAEGMRTGWNPTAAMLGGSDGDDLKAGGKNLLKQWGAAGSTFGETGNPFAGPAPEFPADRARPEGPPEALPGAVPGGANPPPTEWVQRWNRGDFPTVNGEVLILLVQEKNGTPKSTQVVSSSGDKRLDESARQAVMEAARSFTPPATGYGLEGTEIRSLWRLEARMNTSVCSPTGCGGTFDEALGVAEMDGFLKTRVRTRVDLVALYGADRE